MTRRHILAAAVIACALFAIINRHLRVPLRNISRDAMFARFSA